MKIMSMYVWMMSLIIFVRDMFSSKYNLIVPSNDTL